MQRFIFKAVAWGSIAPVAAACLTACVTYVQEPAPSAYQTYPRYPAPTVVPPAPATVIYPAPVASETVIRVEVDAPIGQPQPVACPWAPPPMVVEVPPPQPAPEYVWIGGYWVWHGRWLWGRGRWEPPPRPMYHWVNPYYENRNGAVIFIGGHWAAPGVAFVPPRRDIEIPVQPPAAGAPVGVRPTGPNGVFVPPPPGSRPGIIVPAPIGVAPAVVTSSPPVVNVGMRIHADTNNTTINNVTQITNVTVTAPPGTTADGKGVNASVPAQAHLAASLPLSRGARSEPVNEPRFATQPAVPLQTSRPDQHERQNIDQPVETIRIDGRTEPHANQDADRRTPPWPEHHERQDVRESGDGHASEKQPRSPPVGTPYPERSAPAGYSGGDRHVTPPQAERHAPDPNAMPKQPAPEPARQDKPKSNEANAQHEHGHEHEHEKNNEQKQQEPR